MIDSDVVQNFQEQLLTWYRKNARSLPWRETQDPYRIWVSEIMLQQTRVETVIPYYQQWLEQFPTIQDLASASEDQVLKTWEGLGYYGRARNLHKSAQILISQYGGQLPRDPKDLQDLPGIGPYSAGAIASIAFDVVAPVLDGNIKRVLTRVFNITIPIETTPAKKLLWDQVAELLPQTNPGEFNQALMELGALVCLPTNPDCSNCPLSQLCQARRLNKQGDLPVRKEKKPLPLMKVAAAVIEKDGRYLIGKRPSSGLLGGLWEFPGGKQEKGETLPEALKRELDEELSLTVKVGELIGHFDHAYTHYRVRLSAFQCRVLSESHQLNYHTEVAWAALQELDTYPMGKLDRQIADQLIEKG